MLVLNDVVLYHNSRDGHVGADRTLCAVEPRHQKGPMMVCAEVEVTHNRDTVATDAGVALEHDVAALVDRQTVILVMDSANKIPKV